MGLIANSHSRDFPPQPEDVVDPVTGGVGISDGLKVTL